MTQLIVKTIEWYRDLMENRSDPRVSKWFMMSSPFPTIAACLFYVYFAKVLGPRLMEKRKAFDLRKVIVGFNFMQSLLCLYIFYEVGQSGWFNGYKFSCQPVDYSNDPNALRMANAGWWFFFSKFLDFFDTMLFTLRKKHNQVSALHVTHHGLIPFVVWLGVKFVPGGHSSLAVFLNAFVHVIVYFYYTVAAMGPKYQKYIWWKKYVTIIQIAHLTAIVYHQLQLLFTDCNYPKFCAVWIGFTAAFFIYLFLNFYKENYYKNGLIKKDFKSSELCNGNGNSNGSCKHINSVDDKNSDVTNGSVGRGGSPLSGDPLFSGNTTRRLKIQAAKVPPPA